MLIRNAGYDIDYSSLNSDLLMIGSIQAAGGVMDTLIRFFEENIKIHWLLRSVDFLHSNKLFCRLNCKVTNKHKWWRKEIEQKMRSNTNLWYDNLRYKICWKWFLPCGKMPYVLGDKSDKIHKTKTSQISLRGFVGEMSRNASAVTITPSKPLGSKKSYMTFSKLRN